ncbi:MAG: NADAR family protein [Eubacteriales bacterium]|nr:NADAR family protein [Eubacteriales bacterium]
MMYDKEIIVRRFYAGEKMQFLFFWGHTAKPGEIGKACLSQWYGCEFEVDGVKYHTTEQYMMAQKALLFNDQDNYEKIMSADNPRDYKALGRKICNFKEDIWNRHKYEIVLKGNLAKFSQNSELKEFLLGTGESVLAEASPYDRIWGIGLAMDNSDIQNPDHWKGENLLGFALMETRFFLKKGQNER